MALPPVVSLPKIVTDQIKQPISCFFRKSHVLALSESVEILNFSVVMNLRCCWRHVRFLYHHHSVLLFINKSNLADPSSTHQQFPVSIPPYHFQCRTLETTGYHQIPTRPMLSSIGLFIMYTNFWGPACVGRDLNKLNYLPEYIFGSMLRSSSG